MALRRVSGLWMKEGRSGKFLAGDVREPIPAGAKLLVFPNTKKQHSTDPDYVLNLAVDDNALEQGASGSGRRDRQSPHSQSNGANVSTTRTCATNQRGALDDFERAKCNASSDDDRIPF